ncbi:MAG: hypothetical protein KY431_07400 [Actinobacteria bacterium]|nr:hypothetical protein [Actinomycetota bacterium]
MGTVVRVDLQGRRVRGWVIAVDVTPPEGMALRPLAGVSGSGPAPELIDLAGWAAWRWAGRSVHFLRTASPPGVVAGLPTLPATPALPVGPVDEVFLEALARPRSVLRLPPAASPLPLVLTAARRGTTLVVTPSLAAAVDLAVELRRAGVATAVVPGEWARAAAGARVVIGARAAAWAPAVDLAAVVVVDEHDEAHQSEASPTWNARDVAAERARRAGAGCVLTSPCPSLEALAWGPVLAPSRTDERAGWPVVDVVDRRREEPLRADLYSPRLVALARSATRGDAGPGLVTVLNRKGRAALLACGSCAELARCETCGAAVAEGDDATLGCRRCGASRPRMCLRCGSTRLKVLRPGVRRARDDLERLAGVAVAEITGDSAAETGDAPVVVGTEAVLHRVTRARAVAFLDLDAELLAPRYRAAEQALALVALAARRVGPKAGGGRLVLQTRLPGHEVVQAALHADPARVTAAEAERRQVLALPPATALAMVSGAPAIAFVEGLRGRAGVEVLGPVSARWLVRAPDHQVLCDALAATPRPPGRLRVAVDPLRV